MTQPAQFNFSVTFYRCYTWLHVAAFVAVIRLRIFRHTRTLFWHVSFVANPITWSLADSASLPHAVCHRDRYAGNREVSLQFQSHHYVLLGDVILSTYPTRGIVNFHENFPSTKQILKHKEKVYFNGLKSRREENTQRTRAEEIVDKSVFTQKFMRLDSCSRNRKSG